MNAQEIAVAAIGVATASYVVWRLLRRRHDLPRHWQRALYPVGQDGIMIKTAPAVFEKLVIHQALSFSFSGSYGDSSMMVASYRSPSSLICSLLPTAPCSGFTIASASDLPSRQP